MLRCVAACCNVLKCVAFVYPSIRRLLHIECVAVYCSVLQCVAACCSVLPLSIHLVGFCCTSSLMFICRDVHTCIPAYMHTCIHTCIHAHIHAYTRTYMHTYMQTYMQVREVHTSVGTGRGVRVPAHIHTYMRIHIHTNTHTHRCVRCAHRWAQGSCTQSSGP